MRYLNNVKKMTHNQQQEGSYTMLLSMIIALLLVSLFIFRQDLFNGGKKTPNVLERGFEAVDQAKNVSNTEKERTQDINQILDNK